MRRDTIICLGLLTFSSWANFGLAQQTQRSSDHWTTKTSGVSSVIPCAGTTLLSEDFENGIPGTWTIIDGDGLSPVASIGLLAGWQGRTDYRDSLADKAAVSPSWYAPVGQSDDWLITPAITLGSNACLSWESYSQDPFFKESYEVRIATTTDTSDFLANAPLTSILAELGTPHYNAVSLLAWAGQTVHIAFRQTSDDKFVLVLDDILVTNVNNLDVGVIDYTYGDPDPGDTVTVRLEVANYGSDTVTEFHAHYHIDGGPVKNMHITAVSLPPNSTVSFDHDSLYVSDSIDFNHVICAWTTLPNNLADEEPANDSLCGTLTVGSPVSVLHPDEDASFISVYPSPTHGDITVSLSLQTFRGPVTLQVFDLQGRELIHDEVSGRLVELMLPTRQLPAGMYIIQASAQGARTSQRFLKQ